MNDRPPPLTRTNVSSSSSGRCGPTPDRRSRGLDAVDRREAPDAGMATSQKALNEMSPEERSEVADETERLFRVCCMEALLQLERLTLGIWETHGRSRQTSSLPSPGCRSSPAASGRASSWTRPPPETARRLPPAYRMRFMICDLLRDRARAMSGFCRRYR
jgi:hypothetical protein